MTERRLLTDEALGEGNDPSLDGLGFATYSRVLGQAALETPGPLTIGVFGEWGTGKTSLMRMIQDHLAKENNVVTVWFNAWRYEKEEHPIVPLVATIVREMERNQTTLRKLKDQGAALIRALRAVAYGFSAKSKVKVPGFAEVEASFIAKDMIEREKSLTPDPLLDRSLYYEAFERLSSLPVSSSLRVVVIVDDLDRCFPDLAIRLLESIKLVLSQPGFVFILGVARNVIEGYLQHRYQEEYGIGDFQGQSYLDKIVQLPFHIPSHRGRMNSFTEKIIARIDEDLQSQMQLVLPIIASASGSNPRSTVRFVNNLLIDTAINRELAQAGEMTELSLEYFAITRCLQLRWPQVFSILVRSAELCSEMAEWTQESFRIEANSEDTERASVAATLIGDGDLSTLLYSEQGKLWLSQHSLRRATVEFLRTQRQDREDAARKASRRYDVFFSYSSADRGIVTEIAEYLSMHKMSVFMDTEIQLGENIERALESAIKDSRALAFFVSPTSLKSKWAWNEANTMLDRVTLGEDVRVIPVILAGVEWSELPPSLSKFQALDFREGLNDEGLKSFVRALRS
jgi:hypothetical protein